MLLMLEGWLGSGELDCSAVAMAASYSDSEAVFKRRVETSGLSDEDVANLLSGLKTLKLAFVSSYTPGQADEGPLLAAFSKVVKRDTENDLAAQASFRALFHTAYAIVTTELRQAVEKSDESVTRTLSAPEREERYTRQVKKLNGVAIKGDTEPSEALVDFCVSIYEGNTLRFIPWEKCTSRLAEIQGDAKKDTRFTLDAQGKSLKLEAKPQDLQCAVDSEIHVMQALQRRALACDQANLIDYTILEEWHQRLMRARLQDVPPGYVRPSFKQLLRADQRLFAELQDRSRTGIQSDADGRPLDKLLPHVMDLTEVTMLMQPLPAPRASSTDVYEKPWVGTGKERLSPYGKVKDGKGKGKTKGKRTVVLPKALVGCYSCTASGENICYDFNINGCSRAVKNNRCERGIHICARCRQTGHNAANCPKKE